MATPSAGDPEDRPPPVVAMYEIGDPPAVATPSGGGPATGVVGGALLAVAGVLAVVGTLPPLIDIVWRVAGAGILDNRITGWTNVQTTDRGQFDESTTRWGVPLVVAGVLAIVLGVRLARRHGPMTRTYRIATACAGLLIGTVWAVGMYVLAMLDTGGSPGPGAPTTTVTVGAGGWLLFTAALLCVAGLVVTVRAGPPPAPTYLADLDTPPTGFPRPDQPAPPPTAPGDEPGDGGAGARSGGKNVG